jgi:2-methylcitrate dehydratase PrpD
MARWPTGTRSRGAQVSSVAALDELARFAAEVRLDDFPPQVRAHAPWVLLDVIGAALAGSSAPEAGALADSVLARQPSGCATVLRRALPRTSAAEAAWLNGISAVWLELDPGHRHCRTHAPAHVMPAALAEAQFAGASGAELLASFVTGCEVAYRVGRAITPRAEVNAHGTWGILGATAAVARLRGVGPAVMSRALRLAAQLPIATAFRASIDGVTVRHAYVGAAALLASQAVSLAQAGFTALDDAADESFGRVLGTRFEPSALLDGLGSRYEFVHDFAKLHACCHHAYPAVDALAHILSGSAAPAQAIDAIHVDTYSVASRLRNPAPVNELAAKFSIPFVLAAYTLRRSLDPEAFRNPMLEDPDLRALAARIEVREAPALTARFPRERCARVQVRFAGGEVLHSERHGTRGDYLDPLTPEERTGKFDSLAAAVLPAGALGSLRERLLHIEQVRNTAHLFAFDTSEP